MTLFLLKNSSQQISKVQQTWPLPSASRSLLKRHVLAQFTASFWLVALSTGSNYTSLLAANLCFSVATFWYKLVQFLGDNIQSFPQLFSNEVSNSLPFLLWIHLRVSRLWAILLWKCINFFALHGGFLHITSFIGILQGSFFQGFKVHGFMDVCARFLN